MEDWQIATIRKNLPKLLSWTNCNTQLLAILHAENVLAEDDMEALKCKKKSNCQADLLYEILKTRRHAYYILVKALIVTKQTGAAELLLEIPTKKLTSLQVTFLGNVQSLETQLNPDQIKHIQGWLQKNLSLEERLETHEQVLCQDGPFKLLLDTIPLQDPLYIPRFLSRRQEVSPELFQENCSDIFVVRNAQRDKLRNLVISHEIGYSTSQLLLPKITARLIILDVESNWKKICNKVTLSQKDIPVHLIRYEDVSEQFFLEETSGNSDILRKYLHHSTEKQNEDNFLETILKENVRRVCICDSPGMGKSYLLASLARKMNANFSDRIVAFIQLQNFKPTDNLCSNTTAVATLQAQLLQQLATSKFAQCILTELVKCQNIELEVFFDGLDEVMEGHLDSTTVFLQQLVESIPEVRVFVTSRPVVQGELEKTLRVISYDIVPFNTETQVRFLTSHWQQTEQDANAIKLEEYAQFCLNSFEKFLKEKEKNITGIPLQCKLIADVYGKDAGVYADKNCKIPIQLYSKYFKPSLLEIYSKFLIRQLGETNCNFECFYKTYESQSYLHSRITSFRLDRKTNVASTQCRKECRVRNFHVWEALKLIFPDLASQLVELVAHHDEVNVHENLAPGIMKTNLQNQNLEFLHRTFAEYLVAEYFWKGVFLASEEKLKKNHEKLKQLILNQVVKVKNVEFSFSWLPCFREGVVAYFLDCMITEGMHKKNLELYAIAKISPLNNAYFAVLQICIRSRFKGLLQVLFKATENSKLTRRTKIPSFFRKFLNTKESRLEWQNDNGEYEELKINTNVAKKILYIAAEHCSVNEYDRIVAFFLEVLNIDLNQYVWPPPIAVAIRRANFELVHFFADKMSLENQGLIYECFRNTYFDTFEAVEKKLDIAILLFSKCPSLIIETWKEGIHEYKTPIHVPNSSITTLKFLVQKGCDILIPNESGHSIIYSAAVYMSDVDFFELCRFICVDCNAKSYFLDPENWIGYVSNSECWINTRPSKSLFRILCFLKIELEFAEKIPSLKSLDIYKKCRKVFNSLVYSALTEGKVDFADLLLSYDNSIIDLKCYREANTSEMITATLYTASEIRELNLLKYFMSRGSYVFNVNSRRETILHLAAKTRDCDFFHAVLCMLGERWNEIRNVEELLASGFHGPQTKKEPGNILELFNWIADSLETPLHYAVRFLKGLPLSTLDLLLTCVRHQANAAEVTLVGINAGNGDGETALHIALVTGQRLELVKHLISRGADWTFTGQYDFNVAHYCAKVGLIDHLKYFVELGCDINAGDWRGSTPLLEALKTKQSLELVKYLVKVGADWSGRNVAQKCEVYGLYEHLKYFLELGCESQPATLT